MIITGRPAFATFAVLMFTVSCASTHSQANQSEQALPTPRARQRIESADQLPLHTYRVATTARALFDDSVQFAALAAQLQADLRADLAAYDIQDRATLKNYFNAFSNLALLRGDYRTAVAYQDSIRAIEDKPGVRLTTGIVHRAMAAAARPPSATIDTSSFRVAFRSELAAVPYAQAQAELATMKANFEGLGPNRTESIIQTLIEPAARSGSIPGALAQRLVALRVASDRRLPLRQVLIDELGRTLAANSVEKADIWAARDVSLDGRAGLTPVLVGIWDTGVDVTVFPGQLFTNAGEIPDNGKDDDGNGYVDDVHGIAHDANGNRATGTLFQLSLTSAEQTESRSLTKGESDMRAGLENADVDAFRRKVASTPPAELKSLREKQGEYGIWSHGTHVAGIALRGNPAARLLVAREGTDEFKTPRHPPTLDEASKQAQAMRETIDYFRQHKVRVVNMSWGTGANFIERDLTDNNVGRTAEERRRLARQIFDIEARALHDAMAGAPDILFAVAAGNFDSDNKFSEFVPAAFDLPNMITVAAVDRGGDEAKFTSYGKVDVYANGFAVRSVAPGGYEIPMSGTSMAAPQVVNLAAKLLALKPGLTVAELRRAIVESADEKTIGPGKKIRLLNPKAAVARIGSSGPTGGTVVEGALAIENVTVIAMDGAPDADHVHRGMTVLVAGGRVRALGPGRDVQIPAGATRIDGTGRYLIPGLRDMHVHINGQNGERGLRWMLAAGVTGARVLGGSPAVLQFRERIRRGDLSGPDLYTAGPILEGVAPAGFEELVANAGKVIVHDSVEAARMVREQAAAGYDFIKVYNNLPADAYRGIIIEAKRLGLPVAGHVPFAVGLDGALSARQVSIEHLRAYERALVPVNAPQQPGPDLRSRTLSWAYADASKIRAVAQRTRDAGVWNVPTLETRRVFQSDSEFASYLRSEGANAAQVKTALAGRRSIAWLRNFTPADFAAASTGFAAQDSLVRALVGVGAGIMAGTDGGIYGIALHHELELLVGAGLTPYQALESATRSPAKFLGLEDGSGTVAVGAPADLVLLDANPLEKISNTRSIRGVVRRGVWLDRAALDSLRAEAATSTARRPESSITSVSRRGRVNASEPATVRPAARQRIETADQLPRHSYPIGTTVTSLFQDEKQFAALAQQVATDLRADLSKYDIQDHATLKRYYGMLSNLALERADYKTAVAYQDSIRAVEDKPGLRLSAGILERALSAAARAPGEPLDTARFRQAFRGEVAALPYPEGVVALTAMKRRFELRPIPLRQVRVRIEPNAAASRSLTLELAQRLIAMRVERDRIASVRPVILAELAGIMASHKTATADIWPARDVSLEGRTDLTPVTIAIWDSGVDVGVYPGQLFTNPGEIADNGKDDDGDGYIDDVHGIAYDLEHGRVTGLLYPLTPAELSEFRDRTKRASDRATGLNAPEADTVRRSAAISGGDVPSPRLRAAGYGHGTQVAGVAIRGNPAARILVARRSVGMGGDDPLEDPHTMEHARAFAQEFRESTEYFRQHGVRVVNMSWGFSPGVYEANLIAHNIGTPEDQRRLARQMFDVVATALRDAISAAPNVLFVAAAGNLDLDVEFNESVPPSFNLPNLIIAGAVDAAGDETSFTNHGKVDVYANGYQVFSKAPGGFTIPADGTSISAPQVVSLAAKLLAVNPRLTVAQLRRAILESADEKATGSGKSIKLLNPRAAFDLIVKPAAQATLPLQHTPRPTVPAITAADLSTRLYIVADDSMQGRRTGEPGNLKATAYIEREVRRLGLMPAGDSGGYFQVLPLVRHAVSAKSSLSVDSQPLLLGTDYAPLVLWPTSPFIDVQVIYGGDVAHPVVTAEQARGRFVLLTAAGLSSAQDIRPAAGPESPLAAAAAVGIAAMQLYPPDVLAHLGNLIGFRPGGAAADRPRRPMVLLSTRAAELLLGVPLAGAQVGATGKTVRGQILYEDSPAPAPNVIAILPGSDPKLRHEYVALGAHSDHVGAGRPMDHDSIRAYNAVMRPQGARTRSAAPPTRGLTAEQHDRIRVLLDSLRRVNPDRPDSVFNGADDDASGSVALLEIAERLATQQPRPRRSILFVWHTGEELGALGSKWFVQHPTVPRDSIVAQLTLDMIGRGGASDVPGGGPDFLQLIGSRRLSTELGDIVEAVNRGKPRPFRLDYAYDALGEPQRIYCSGDHASYARFGIPVTAFFTGLHRDYHQVSDESEYIDYAHLAGITQLVHDVARRVADLDHRLVVDKPKSDPTAPCVQ